MSAGTVPTTPAHQGTLGFIDRPLRPGDTVSFYTDDNGYRTGSVVRTKRSGDIEIRSTCELRRGRLRVVVSRGMVRTL